MNVLELLLLALVGWTLLGMIGLLISLVRRERAKLVNGVRWMVGVWVVYLAVLVAVSLWQPQRVVRMGQEQCFDEMCFAVMKLDEPQFEDENGLGDGSRLVRIAVKVRNKARGKSQSEALIRAYLVDAQGRRWEESRGVSGNRLTGKVGAGGEMVSEPVFNIAEDATGLGLVFTHGRWQPGLLVIGDSDSLLHRHTVVWLGR